MKDALVDVAESRPEWLSRLIVRWGALYNKAVLERGFFSVALSGGASPKAFFQGLADLGFGDEYWGRVLFFWSDERWVKHDHEESNFRMAHELLISRIPVPSGNVYPWKTGLSPEDCAADYDALLKKVLGSDETFDLVLLGIGSDGHTASLFPGTCALHETERLAVANEVPQAKSRWRLTLTYPCIAAAREAWFIVSGKEKGGVLETLMQPGCPLPAAQVVCRGGLRLYWCKE